MRKRLAPLAATAVALLLLLPGCSTGSSSSGPEHIDSFAIDYTIAKSGMVHVVETIKYDFGSTPDRHGIQRFLESHFADTADRDRVYEYSNLHVTSPTGASTLVSTARQEDLLITIGNQNATLGGKQTYILSYDIRGALNRAKDDSKTVDVFYWNATGTEWNVPIDKTTITVHGAGDSTAAACVAGSVGSDDPCLIANKKGDGATFKQGQLTQNQGVTIDVAWPSGTYDNVKPILKPVLSPDAPEVYAGSNDGPDPFWTPWNWGGGILLLLLIPLAFLLFVRVRQRDQEFTGETPGTIPTDLAGAPVGPAPASETIVPFYDPPPGFPVGAVSLLMDKQQGKTDVTVTLLDLAARGHLRIEEVEGGSRGKASDYKLVATPEKATVGDTAGMLAHETLLLHDLFGDGKTEVTLSSLKYTFASEYTAVEVAIKAFVQGKAYFLDKLTRSHPVLGWILFGSIVTLFAMFFFDKAWVFWPIGAGVGAILSLRQGRKAIRRSALGHAVLVQLQGFKLYIATAEADQIKFEEGIDVFSRFLPWATAFGEADHWTGVFAQLAKEGKYTDTPDWYVGGLHTETAAGLTGSLLAISSLGAAVNSFSSFAQESMSATVATSSSSGGSGFGGGDFGGGFSGDVGGGGGGGGGGSW